MKINQKKLIYEMKNKIKIYIASAYTIGDVAANVKTQIDVANELMNMGFNPYVPLYSHFQHMIHPRPYQDWIERDLEWINVCDCLLRIPGKSSGADMEVQYATDLNKPVFYSKEELFSYYEKNKQRSN